MGLGLRFMLLGGSSPVAPISIATPAFRPSRRGVALFIREDR